MEEILHRLIGSFSHYLQGFIHSRWWRISCVNSMYDSHSLLMDETFPQRTIFVELYRTGNCSQTKTTRKNLLLDMFKAITHNSVLQVQSHSNQVCSMNNNEVGATIVVVLQCLTIPRLYTLGINRHILSWWLEHPINSETHSIQVPLPFSDPVQI